MNTSHTHSGYRLTSPYEPTDEELHLIMRGVQQHAQESTRRAQQELQRRFNEMAARIAARRQSQNSADNHA